MGANHSWSVWSPAIRSWSLFFKERQEQIAHSRCILLDPSALVLPGRIPGSTLNRLANPYRKRPHAVMSSPPTEA